MKYGRCQTNYFKRNATKKTLPSFPFLFCFSNFRIRQSIRCHVKNGKKTCWNLFVAFTANIHSIYSFFSSRASLKFASSHAYYLMCYMSIDGPSKSIHHGNSISVVKATVLWLSIHVHCFDGWHNKYYVYVVFHFEAKAKLNHFQWVHESNDNGITMTNNKVLCFSCGHSVISRTSCLKYRKNNKKWTTKPKRVCGSMNAIPFHPIP